MIGASLLAAALGLGCTDTSTGTATIASPTLVTVDPAEFRGGLLCGDFPGAWKTYVATLTDVTDPANPAVLASSRPVPCAMSVSFAFVVTGHYYTTDIDGYDRSDITPVGGASSGSREMVDGLGSPVAPRWRTSCGKAAEQADAGSAEAEAGTQPASSDAGAQPTESWTMMNIIVRHCGQLKDVGPAGPTGVALDLKKIRGETGCGDGAAIEGFRVVPTNSSLPTRTAGCDDSVQYDSLAGATYDFRVEGLKGGVAVLATRCSAASREGIIMPASCDPLTSRGGLQVRIGPLLEAAQLQCAEGQVVSYRGVLVGSGDAPTEAGCDRDMLFTHLDSGPHTVLVDLLGASGIVQASAVCEGTTQPAQSVQARCDVTK
jgi:hypothetical protein